VYTGVNQEVTMIRTGIKEIRKNLTKYLESVQRGEEIIITKRDEPIAKIVPIRPKQARALSSREQLRSLIKPQGTPLSQVVAENREERL
jgi:prevent-host-death family protein